MNRTHFRQLVAAIALLAVAAIIIELLFPSLIPAPIRAADEAYQNVLMDEKSSLSLVFFALFLLANLVGSIAAIIGLFFFKRWSVWLNALLIAVAPFTWLTLGYLVSSWVAMFVFEWVSIALGAALAVAWFTPLREEFK